MMERTKSQVPYQMTSWKLWAGYAACAWGLWFAALHVPLFFGGGSFRVQSQFAHTPWVYMMASGLSVILFFSTALFPLALVWRSWRWINQRCMQIMTLVLAYMGMIGFTIYELVIAQEFDGFLLGAGVCSLGVVVAFVRPRNQSIAHWMTLIATWAIGIGMTLYGGAYMCLSFFQPTLEEGIGYFFLGGVNFTVEGIFFVAVAWMVSYWHR